MYEQEMLITHLSKLNCVLKRLDTLLIEIETLNIEVFDGYEDMSIRSEYKTISELDKIF